MRILITGGMGFIGSAVTKLLLTIPEVDSISIIDNLSPKIHGNNPTPCNFNDKRVHFIKGDVRNREDIIAPLLNTDVVIHLAAETGTGQSMYEIHHYTDVNISATSLMLDLLCNNKHNVKKFIIASSRAIYGEGKYYCDVHGTVYPNPRLTVDMEQGDFEVKCPLCGKSVQALPTTEDSMIHPISLYGITKQVQEQLVMGLCPHLGIAPTSLRYQNVFGPGQSLNNPYTGIISIFSNLVKLNKDIEIFEDGRETRDFVYIDDIAEATVKSVINPKASGEIFNVGSGVATSVLDVATLIAKNHPSGVKTKITGKFRVGDIKHNFADISKIQKQLDFKPCVSFTEGLNLFLNWANSQEAGDDLFDKSLSEMKSKGLYK